MRGTTIVALILTLLAPTAGGAPGAETVLDEVLVTGEQAGPGLWKVTRPSADGDHVPWILGTYGPLSKKMQWRSRRGRACAEGQ